MAAVRKSLGDRLDTPYEVGFFGHTETYTDEHGALRHRWVPGQMVRGIAYDTAIPGYLTRTVNRLRLWRSEAVDAFNLAVFNAGDYVGAVHDKIEWETISKILYPPDEKVEGKRLRCGRKLRHPHLLSALMHAAQLNDPGLSIYECQFCGGLHLGHARPRDSTASLQSN